VLDLETDDDEYEVERILDHKVIRKKDYYLVKWKGFSDLENTWEPKRNLKNCQQMLRQYHREGPTTAKRTNQEATHLLPTPPGSPQQQKQDQEEPPRRILVIQREATPMPGARPRHDRLPRSPVIPVRIRRAHEHLGAPPPYEVAVSSGGQLLASHEARIDARRHEGSLPEPTVPPPRYQGNHAQLQPTSRTTLSDEDQGSSLRFQQLAQQVAGDTDEDVAEVTEALLDTAVDLFEETERTKDLRELKTMMREFIISNLERDFGTDPTKYKTSYNQELRILTAQAKSEYENTAGIYRQDHVLGKALVNRTRQRYLQSRGDNTKSQVRLDLVQLEQRFEDEPTRQVRPRVVQYVQAEGIATTIDRGEESIRADKRTAFWVDRALDMVSKGRKDWDPTDGNQAHLIYQPGKEHCRSRDENLQERERVLRTAPVAERNGCRCMKTNTHHYMDCKKSRSRD